MEAIFFLYLGMHMSPLIFQVVVLLELVPFIVYTWNTHKLEKSVDERILGKGLPLAGIYIRPYQYGGGPHMKFRITKYRLDEDYSDKIILALSKRYDKLLTRLYVVGICTAIAVTITICIEFSKVP